VTQAFAGRQEIVARSLKQARAGALGQSLLFVGPEGSGKEATALEIARLINCPTPEACADAPACESCRKAVTFQHPDIRWIGPAPASVTDADVVRLLRTKQEDPFHTPPWAATSEVLIGDPDKPGPLTVRSLLQFLRLKPFQGTTKVAVVADAHRLRAGAANAFLKALEEPPTDALILLLSATRSAVLPTIQSRCHRVVFRPYARDELAALLRDLYGLPADEADRLARVSAGDARRAARLRLPLARACARWAAELADALDEGRLGGPLLAAEQVHKGVLPPSVAEAAGEKIPAAKDLPARRERAILLCEGLTVHYSEILACLARGDAWEPLDPARETAVRAAASRRSPAGLLADLESLGAAQRDVENNLNIGLMMAVLFQELVRHVQTDRSAAART